MSKPSHFAALCLAAWTLTACGTADDAPSGEAVESARDYVVQGKVAGVYAEDDPPTLTVHHETIDGFMDSMTMPFVVDGEVSLAGIGEGDKVKFTLTVDATADEPYLITAVEKLPADTVLEIAVQPPAP